MELRVCALPKLHDDDDASGRAATTIHMTFVCLGEKIRQWDRDYVLSVSPCVCFGGGFFLEGESYKRLFVVLNFPSNNVKRHGKDTEFFSAAFTELFARGIFFSMVLWQRKCPCMFEFVCACCVWEGFVALPFVQFFLLFCSCVVVLFFCCCCCRTSFCFFLLLLLFFYIMLTSLASVFCPDWMTVFNCCAACQPSSQPKRANCLSNRYYFSSQCVCVWLVFLVSIWVWVCVCFG